MFDFNMNMLRAFHNVVQSWGPEYRVYADKIQKWTHESLNTGYMVVAEPMNCGLQVLNHGSLNSCKFQTKYDEENNPIDVLLTDFNASFWGSPACDLLSFLMTSVQNNVKVEYFDDLIEHYHLELAEGLKKLSYQKQIPSLKELHADILDKGAYGPYILLIFNMSRSNTDITFDQLYKGGDEVDKLFKIVFENEIFVKACRKWMPFLNSREFLECLI